MFYAAHVALLGVPGAKEAYKTHRGIVADFGKLVVQPGTLDAKYGRSFNDIQKLRELADYLGDPPSLENAKSALVEAQDFVAAVLSLSDLPSA